MEVVESPKSNSGVTPLNASPIVLEGARGEGSGKRSAAELKSDWRGESAERPA